MRKDSLIRTIYLYLFACLGLVLLAIGGVRFVDMGLKAFIFTRADEEQNLYRIQPPSPAYPFAKMEEAQDDEELTEEERAAIRQWLEEYKAWQEGTSKVDYVAARRHRDASLNLSLILIGLPLYLYHWIIIKRETKNKKDV